MNPVPVMQGPSFFVPIIFWVYGVGIATVIVHIAFAVGVLYDVSDLPPPDRRTYLVSGWIWALATLLGGAVVAGIYWLVHHSAMRPTAPPPSHGQSAIPQPQRQGAGLYHLGPMLDRIRLHLHGRMPEEHQPHSGLPPRLSQPELVYPKVGAVSPRRPQIAWLREGR